MSMLSEFKEFAVKGNMVDMAVGIIVGGAFGKIVSSLVGDIIMPAVGMITGGVDFSQKALVLKEATEGAEAVLLKYGAFAQNIIDFLIVAFAIFMVVKGINSLRKEEEAVEETPAPTKDQELLEEIRDALKSK